MRSIAIILVSFLLLVSLSWTSHAYIDSVGAQLNEQAQALEALLQDEQWERAEQSLRAFRAYWSAHKGKLTVLLDHQDMNDFEAVLVRLESYSQNRAAQFCLTEAVMLQRWIENLRERERFNLSNIF
ncbi:MAG: DUF4363 family protein, partial [Peptococcaceae bacterium]|nr:DUF4363 family protein [Peptococcaceae bacterium]